jgi:hypothetical protein
LKWGYATGVIDKASGLARYLLRRRVSYPRVVINPCQHAGHNQRQTETERMMGANFAIEANEPILR